jgi:hypothetical protein
VRGFSLVISITIAIQAQQNATASNTYCKLILMQVL